MWVACGVGNLVLDKGTTRELKDPPGYRNLGKQFIRPRSPFPVLHPQSQVSSSSVVLWPRHFRAGRTSRGCRLATLTSLPRTHASGTPSRRRLQGGSDASILL